MEGFQEEKIKQTKTKFYKVMVVPTFIYVLNRGPKKKMKYNCRDQIYDISKVDKIKK